MDTHPQYEYKQLLYELLKPGLRWLDLGCGRSFIATWTVKPGEDIRALASKPALSVGIDCYMDSLYDNHLLPNRVFGNVEHLPFSDNAFDLVTANMVMEHVAHPMRLLNEVRRVLAP